MTAAPQYVSPLRVGDLIEMLVDFPERPLTTREKPFDRGRYRVTQIRMGYCAQNLPVRHRYVAVLRKETKGGRQYAYAYAIYLSYFDRLGEEGFWVLERGERDWSPPPEKPEGVE